ncbi:ISEhe3 transposase A [Yersinia enterocolitica]|nr:ISEhe3 transposase A [Yersinia enterocolitica]CRY33334.1 ISEhe3 transposase A [Yersinia enterocolitica]
MGTPRFTPEFKEEADRQITERSYSVADVSEHLGVSAHSLYKWADPVTPRSTELQWPAQIFLQHGISVSPLSLYEFDVLFFFFFHVGG